MSHCSAPALRQNNKAHLFAIGVMHAHPIAVKRLSKSPVASGAYNLITTMNETEFDAAPLNSDPRLLPLVDNEGFTKTHALAADSPAIMAGHNLLELPFDQRGMPFPREIGGLTDIGAFERGDSIFSDSFE